MPRSTVDRQRQGVEGHLAAAVEYIKIFESDDPGQSALEHAAIEIDAAKQEDPSLTNVEIGRRISKSSEHVSRLLTALARARAGDEFQVDWRNYGRNRDQVGARNLARKQPEIFAEAFEQAPTAAKRKIAEQISRSPEVRAAARQHDAEAERKRKPESVKPRVDHSLYEFESRLVSSRRLLREALALVDSIDQPGDDEDILELLAMLKQLVDANEEAYRSGKSLDTWAWELYERSAD